MKFYLINGSPRKKRNTVQIIEKIGEGIKETLGEIATIEKINIYDLNYTGCKSCFSCKRLGGKHYGECAIKDDLNELLPKLWDCDGIIFGSPIYFGNVTGELKSFIERFLFPKFVYSATENSLAEKKMPIAMVYTMNVKEEISSEMYESTIYTPLETFIETVFTKPYSLKIYNTYQFKDYSKFKNDIFDETEKAKYLDEHFPIDLENAFNLGIKIAEDAGKLNKWIFIHSNLFHKLFLNISLLIHH